MPDLPAPPNQVDRPFGKRLLPKATPAVALLADHDEASLTQTLIEAGGSRTSAKAAAAKVLRYVFGRSDSEGNLVWSAEVFSALGIGAWAHPTLMSLDPHLSLIMTEQTTSVDDVIRLVLSARDGSLIEAVLIPGPARTTLCISSQVGCARACSFCETGRLGLTRQLRAGEIVDQIRVAQTFALNAPLQNLVLMGMGEPFDNLVEVLRALRLLTNPRAFGFAPSRITVSTVGVADKLSLFFAGTRAELAISLNAPDDARRTPIMPINARFPLATLKQAIVDALPPRRRVLFEYVVFDGYNDAVHDADLLASYVAGLRCRVNVIPCNPGPDPTLRPPTSERLDAFVSRLTQHGITTLVRRPRGREIGGACGQLAGAARQTG